MPDDLRTQIADLRQRTARKSMWALRARDALQTFPALADAYEAALLTIAERDAEIGRLREALRANAARARTWDCTTMPEGSEPR